MDRAIAACKIPHPTYWEILPYLPSETQNYVPIYIAASIIALNPEAYDFVHIEYLDPLLYEPYPLSRSYQVQDLAECAGVSLDEFVELNPHILQSYTPSNVDDFEVRIPKGTKLHFSSRLRGVQEVNFAEKGLHRVGRGETLAKVAKKYNVSLAELKRANDIKKNRALTSGEMLYIPKKQSASGVNLTAIDNVKSNSGKGRADDPMRNTRGRRQVSFTVEKGMTLGKVAGRYNCSVADIMTWNSMKSGDALKTGQSLVVWTRGTDGDAGAEVAAAAPVAPASVETLPLVQAKSMQRTEQETVSSHRVKRGETLASIASASNVTIDNLMAWNNLRDQNVRSGKVLKIFPGKGNVAGRPLYDSSKVHVEAVPAPVKASPVKEEKAIHIVKQGETLWGISEQYSVSPDQIRQWNNLRDDNIMVGQKLAVQPGEAKQARNGRKLRAAAERSVPKTHIVKDGEGLWSIGQLRGVSVDSLIIWNNLETTTLRAGQELALVAPSAAVKNDRNKGAAQIPDTYTVARRDKLSSIAKRYGLSVDAIRAWNDIKGDDIREGQVLRFQKPATPAVQKKSSVRVQKSGELVPQSYVVESGETLFGIAKKLGVSVEDLQTWNKLQTSIRAGQTLTYYDSGK